MHMIIIYIHSTSHCGAAVASQVSELTPGPSNQGLSPRWGHWVVCLGTGESNVGGKPAMDYYFIQEGVEILLVALCYRN